jgi:tRNA(Arg) A34 adenosine deaminase TadA
MRGKKRDPQVARVRYEDAMKLYDRLIDAGMYAIKPIPPEGMETEMNEPEHDHLREAMAAVDQQETEIADTVAGAAVVDRTEHVDVRSMILDLQQSKYPDDNIAALLRERGKTHGEFTDHAMVTQQLKQIVRTHCNMNSGVRSYELLSPIQQEAIDMILHKIGRIIAGDPNFPDHWDDLSGYPKLVAQRLRK